MFTNKQEPQTCLRVNVAFDSDSIGNLIPDSLFRKQLTHPSVRVYDEPSKEDGADSDSSSCEVNHRESIHSPTGAESSRVKYHMTSRGNHWGHVGSCLNPGLVSENVTISPVSEMVLV